MKLSLSSLIAVGLAIGIAGLAVACAANSDADGAAAGAPASSSADPTSPLPAPEDGASGGTTGSKRDASASAPDASTCVAVTIPAVAPATCTSSADAGMCSPQAGAFAPAKLTPAGAHLGVCTPAEIDAFLANCLGPNAVPHGCESFAKNHGECAICMMPDYGKDPHGVVHLDDDGLASVNITGCIAAAEPCNAPCAQAYADTEVCQKASCAGEACDTVSKRITCFGEAANCECKEHRDRAKCTEALTGPGHPAAGCLGGTTFLEKARSVALVICGS